MDEQWPRIFPLGDSALTVEFSKTISVEANQRAIALSDHFQTSTFPGFIESVPAYSSVSIFYDPVVVAGSFPGSRCAHNEVESMITTVLETLRAGDEKWGRIVEIPVRFDADSALDLPHIAKTHRLTPEDVVEIFISTTYRVFMLGFLPGFSYMGEVDERIATPRKATPRLAVPKGSVGIAGSQAGIYSLESPGGWQIVGRTDLEMFTADADPPTRLAPGDQVRFVAVG